MRCLTEWPVGGGGFDYRIGLCMDGGITGIRFKGKWGLLNGYNRAFSIDICRGFLHKIRN